MSFDTLIFLVFALAVFHAFKLMRGSGWVLFAASIAFYVFAGWRDLALIVVMVFANYGLSHLVDRSKLWLATAVAGNLGCLAFFKYRNFVTTQVPRS